MSAGVPHDTLNPLQKALARLEKHVNTPEHSLRIGDIMLSKQEAAALLALYDVRGDSAAELARVSRERDEAKTRIVQQRKRLAELEAIVAGDDVPRSFYRREYGRLLREHETMRDALRAIAKLGVNRPSGTSAERFHDAVDIANAALAGSRAATPPAEHEAFCVIHSGSVSCNCGVALGGSRAATPEAEA